VHKELLKHSPVKFVIPVGALGLMVGVGVTSTIDMFIAVYGASLSRYYSPAVCVFMRKELKDPDKGVLKSPE